MNTQTVGLKRGLLTQDAIDRVMNELIPQLREAVEKARIADRRCELSTAQMSNLVNVAAETQSVEVVIGYLQYQVGRDAGRRVQWAWQGFGETLIDMLNALKGRAEGIVDSAARQIGPLPTDDDRRKEVEQVWMALVRQFLGHLRRYFIYRKPPAAGRREG